MHAHGLDKQLPQLHACSRGGLWQDTALVSWTDIAAHIGGRAVMGAVLAAGDKRGWQTPWEFVEAGQGDAANKLVVVVRCVNSSLNLARSQQERGELEELATDLKNKFM